MGWQKINQLGSMQSLTCVPRLPRRPKRYDDLRRLEHRGVLGGLGGGCFCFNIYILKLVSFTQSSSTLFWVLSLLQALDIAFGCLVVFKTLISVCRAVGEHPNEGYALASKQRLGGSRRRSSGSPGHHALVRETGPRSKSMFRHLG